MAKILFLNSTLTTPIDEFQKTWSVEFSKNYKPHFFVQFNVMRQLILSKCCSCRSSLVSIKEDMLFCRPLETTCRAENEFKVLPRLLQRLNRLLWKKFVGVYIDNSRTIFESQSKFIAKIKKKL